MKKFLKWIGFAVAGLAAVFLLAIAWIYFASERALSRQFANTDDAALVIPTDAVSIGEGQRVALLAGCMHCHGETLAGSLVDDIPNLIRLVAPNASVILPNYSDAQLATMLRRGVKPDGSSVLFMPSEMFRHLGDQDLARLVAWLRTLPANPEGVQEKTELRLLGRMLLATGTLKPSASAIESLPAAVTTFDASDAASRGRYLTMNYCSECHGQNLEGFAPINAPALAVVQGYSLEQFTTLMQEGVGLGNREFPLMTPTSKARFAHFTTAEIAALYAYLAG